MIIETERAELRQIRALLRLECLSAETIEREALRLVVQRRRLRRYGFDLPAISAADSRRIAERVRGIRPLSRHRKFPSVPLAV